MVFYLFTIFRWKNDNFKILFFSEDPVRSHLKSVYACLAMTILSAATGAYTHLFTNLMRGGGLLFSLLGLGIGLGLYATPDNGKNRPTRLALLLGFGFFSGLGKSAIWLKCSFLLLTKILKIHVDVIFLCKKIISWIFWMTLGITISYNNFWTFSFYEHIEIYTENRLLTAPYKIDKIAVKFLILDFSDPPCSK